MTLYFISSTSNDLLILNSQHCIMMSCSENIKHSIFNRLIDVRWKRKTHKNNKFMKAYSKTRVVKSKMDEGPEIIIT